MPKLAIIADDFTGSLDAGVQFSELGASALVVTDQNYDFSRALDLDVLIFDAETRHSSPEEAYKTIYDFVRRARDSKIPYIYKKTDSGLRGNIGAELAGALDASGAETLAFIPAFPAMQRVTRNGVHYVDGVPVAQSMFGKDPFEPVKFSGVKEIIASQTDRQGIKIYDAETDDDMKIIAENLGHEGLRLTAGCAGFAGVLAHVLGYNGKAKEIPEMPESLFVICGSVNPVTRAQIDFAKAQGFKYTALNAEQKLNPNWPGSKDCEDFAAESLREIHNAKFEREFAEEKTQPLKLEETFTKHQAENFQNLIHAKTYGKILSAQAQNQPCKKSFHAILDANNPAESELTLLTGENDRLNISRAVTGAAKAIIDCGLDARLMCIGGDTLLALMRAIGVNELVPVREIQKGVVLTSFIYNEKKYYIMTKSGGFGDKYLLVKLAGEK